MTHLCHHFVNFDPFSKSTYFNFFLPLGPATQLFRLLNKYRPETKLQKKERLRQEAAKRAESESSTSSKKPPPVVKYGINHVTTLVEQKKAQLVVIAHDVDPIEASANEQALLSANIPASQCGRETVIDWFCVQSWLRTRFLEYVTVLVAIVNWGG